MLTLSSFAKTLAAAAVLPLPDVKNPTNSMYVVATGLDGYRTLVSVGEIHSSFGNGEALIAYRIGPNGGPMEDLSDRHGDMRLVVLGDGGRGRFVSRLAVIEVLAAEPAPVVVP